MAIVSFTVSYSSGYSFRFLIILCVQAIVTCSKLIWLSTDQYYICYVLFICFVFTKSALDIFLESFAL